MGIRTSIPEVLPSPHQRLNCTVKLADGKQFAVADGSSILDAALAAGLMLPHSCRSGRCSSCRVRVVMGSVRPMDGAESLGADHRAAGWALTCVDTCGTDVNLDARDLTLLSGLRLLTLPARIDALTWLTHDVLQVRLRLPPNHGLRYLAGQFIELIGPGGVRRAYSIACGSAAQGLELHISRVPGGLMSEYLFGRARLNDLLRLQGPRGSFHLGEVSGMHLVWLATGTGIAPFKAMLECLEAEPQSSWPARIDLYWGNRRPTDIYWKPAAGALGGRVQFHPVCSRPGPEWQGLRGHVHDAALKNEAREATLLRVFACGSAAMITSARAAFAAWGLNDSDFHADAFLPSGGE